MTNIEKVYYEYLCDAEAACWLNEDPAFDDEDRTLYSGQEINIKYCYDMLRPIFTELFASKRDTEALMYNILTDELKAKYKDRHDYLWSDEYPFG